MYEQASITENSMGATWLLVATCFVDIRGFTTFCNSNEALIHRGVIPLLSCLMGPLQQTSLTMEEMSGGNGNENDVHPAKPNLVKFLGDGAMLVWEYPTQCDAKASVLFSLRILEYIRRLQNAYNAEFKRVKLDYVLDDRPIGIGLSSGYSWRIKRGKIVDYIGVPVNHAARLQDQARPNGLVADIRFAPDIFMERLCGEEGEKGTIELRGTGKLHVWISKSTQIRRWRSKTDPLHFTINSFLGQFSDRRKYPDSNAISIFELRADIEAQFAAELASLVRNDRSQFELALISIEKTVDDMYEMLARDWMPKSEWNEAGKKFHGLIAKYSQFSNGESRNQFTDMMYRHTRPIYRQAVANPQVVVNEHRNILVAIRDGNSPAAYQLMKSHLSDHYASARGHLVSRDGQFDPTNPDAV